MSSDAEVLSYAELEADFLPRYPHTLSQEDKTRAEILLEDASFWLGVWVPGLATAIDNGNEQVTTAARLLVVAMVRRAMLAPSVDEGVQSQNLVAGQFQHNIVYRNPDGNLYLYGKELDAIKGLLRTNPADAVSMTQPGL